MGKDMIQQEPQEQRQAAQSLNRGRIVESALALLDEVGLEGLSTRRLAAHLSIKSASLYWHFRNKDALLDAMCSAMIAASLQPLEPGRDGLDWVDWLAEGARALRKTALSRRDGARVMARSRPAEEAGRRSIQRHVAILTDCGLSETDALFALQTLRRFAIGSALQEQANLAAGNTGRAAVGDEVFEFGLTQITQGLRQSFASAR